MQHPLDVERGRRAHVGRAQARNLGAVPPRDVGDLLGVGRDDDRVEDPGLLRAGDRVGDQRVAGERHDVLAGDTLRAGARGDERDGGRH